jgi:hypothetical protein
MLSEKLVPETNHSNHSSSYVLCSMKMTIFWGYPLVSDPYLWQNCGHPGLLVRIFAILLGSWHQYVGPFVGCFQKGEGIMSQTSGSPHSRNFFVIVLSDKPLNFRGPQLSEIPISLEPGDWPHMSPLAQLLQILRVKLRTRRTLPPGLVQGLQTSKQTKVT